MVDTPIKLAKQLTGLTGEALAKRLGVSAPHLSRLANAKTPTSSRHIKKLAEICDISESEFYKLLGQSGEVAAEESGRKVMGVSPSELLLFDPEYFNLAHDEARRIDAKFAHGKSESMQFAKLQNAIYEFIEHVKNNNSASEHSE